MATSAARGEAHVTSDIEFRFERAEEALDDGIVPAVADATHADGDAAGVEQAPIVVARVLAAAIGVMQLRDAGASRAPGAARS